MHPTARTASWPMYAVDPLAVARFWTSLRAAMLGAGVTGVPVSLDDPPDLARHWRDPALLLSQTCGYPFVTALRSAVRYVCTPRFRVEGCEGGFYRSAIMTRRDGHGAAIAEFRGRRVAYNASDSHSGYNALRAAVAKHSRAGRFFSAAVETTSHRRSLRALRNGEADVAAIDAVTLALVRRAAPEETEGLRVVGYTDPAPGLPLITSRLTDDVQLRRLRDACAAACDPARSAASDLLLDGIEILDEAAYDAIGDMQRNAVALGYPMLA